MSSIIFSIRPGKLEDIDELILLVQDSISVINSKDYSQEQISIWISSIRNKTLWLDRLSTQFFFIAEDHEQIVGLASLASDGLIDFLYIHKNFQRNGIAKCLMEKIEEMAKSKGITELRSEVSITARPFFESRGFQIVQEQRKLLKQIEFVNFIMTKRL